MSCGLCIAASVVFSFTFLKKDPPFGSASLCLQFILVCSLIHNNGHFLPTLLLLTDHFSQIRVRPPSPGSVECVRADVRVPAATGQLCLPYGLLHPPSECVSVCVFEDMLSSAWC